MQTLTETLNTPGAMTAAALAVSLALVLIAHRALSRWLKNRAKPAAETTAGAAPARKLSRGDIAGIAGVLVLALGFVTVAFAMSYATLYKAAPWLADTPLTFINDGDLRFAFPLVVDGLIVYFMGLDLWTEWKKIRHPYYRWTAYGLSVMTLWINITTGDGQGAFAHAAPPLAVIIISEGLAIWIRSMAGLLTTGAPIDRIPAGHWIARPASAARVFRLMLGWNVRSYTDAVEMERRRSLAYAMLREQYGPGWKAHTPRHVRWMLDNGTQLDAAYALVRRLTGERVAMVPDEIAVRPTQAGERVAAHPAHDTSPDADISALTERGITDVERFLADAERPRGGLADLGERPAHPPLTTGPNTPDSQGPKPAQIGGDQPGRTDGERVSGAAHQPDDHADTKGGTAAAADGRRVAGDANRERVADYLARHPGARTGVIAKALGLSSATVRRHRRDLNN